MRHSLWIGCALFTLLGCKNDDDKTPGPEGACPEDEAMFQTHVWEPVLAQNCLVCHSEDGVAETTRFVFKREGESSDWLQNNMRVFSDVANLSEDGTSIVLLKPTNTHSEGHGGAEILTEGSEAYAALAYYASWVRGELEDCDEMGFGGCEDDLPGPRLLRRLTHTAYDNTVLDLLGVESSYGETFATDNVVNGFFNNAGALQVSGLLAEQYRVAAEDIAEQAVNFTLAERMPCDPVEDGQAMCAATFIRDMGQRAFRRPLEESEITTYWTVWDTVAQEDGFYEGIQWVLTAMLQSPHFLYRMEIGNQVGGGAFQLTDWEVATELSYLLWDTMPDEALFEKAAAGSLHTPEQIDAEVLRMMEDPRSDRAMKGFVEQWLHLDRLIKVPKIMQVYPDLTFDIRDEMLGETRRLAAQLMADGGRVEDLYVADHSYMTDTLAAYYGLEPSTAAADAAGYRRVELAGTEYGGLLTQGSLLTTFARPDSSSPIHRGVLVRERLLCQELPPPPPNLEIKPPEMDPEKTTREQYAQHSEDPACADCHERIDPIGFGFEHFDGAGVYREMDGIHPIDDSGEVVKAGSASGIFDGVDGLATLLGGSTEAEDCYVEMWVDYGTGLHENGAMQCATGLISAEAGEDGLALSQPLYGLTRLLHFRNRLGELSEGDAPGAFSDPPDLSEYAAIEDTRYPDLEDGSGGGGGSGEGLVFTLNEVSRWSTGYCADGFVENTTSADITWEVSAEIEGTIVNLWNANKREAGNLTYFTGLSWNSVVTPGSTQSFGFCADL